ncbi:MAG: UvrD-helicase domain-containing protein, partial [Planctomycetota bacterium]
MKKLIKASAGSGKTFQLSLHFLRQLFLGHRPETILATTFTRKAAGEIQGRVLLRLAGAAEDPGEAKLLSEFLAPTRVTTSSARSMLADVTRNLHRLRVCTLDSFFQQIARSLTLELSLTPGWSILDDHTDAELREQAIDAVLSQQLPKDAQQLMHMLAKGRSKRSVRELINETVRNFHELYLITEQGAWDHLPDLHRLTLEQRLECRVVVSEAPLPEDSRAVAAREDDLARFDAGKWDEFLTRGLAGKISAGELTYQRKKIPDELVQAFEPLITHARAEILDALIQRMKGIRNLISRFDVEYERLKDERGWMKFGDVTRVLADSTAAATGQRMNFRLDSSIRNLLLDEFQDTSTDQWGILRRLEESLDKHEESSFFCVGDDKQAIYGWRGGVADMLDEVRRSISGIDVQPLDVSRRSSAAVIETVNHVFQNIGNHSNLQEYAEACRGWSKGFPAHSTAKSTMPGYACFRTSPEFEADTSDDKKADWFRWVAVQIRDLHQQSPGAEIGVLTRKNDSVARLVHELSLLGVRASEEGGTAPTDSPAVLALLSLLHLAAHPGCEVSRYHVAGSPFGPIVGLTSYDHDKQALEVSSSIRARLMDEGFGRTLQFLSEAVRPHCSARDLLRLQQVVAEGWSFDKTPSL